MPFPSPGHLPDPGIELGSLALAGEFFTHEPLGKPPVILNYGDFAHIYLAAGYHQTKRWSTLIIQAQSEIAYCIIFKEILIEKNALLNICLYNKCAVKFLV